MTANLAAQKAGWMTAYANSISKGITGRKMAWDDVRDICDQRTAGDLDGFRLDLLTDMVWQRINGPA